MAETDVVDKTENQESNVSKDSLDIEARATALGWVAADKFRGAPEKHVDAKTYLDKGELVLPLVKKQRDEARQGLDKVSKELAEVKSTMSEFQKLIEADADRKVKEQIALLKEAKATAVEAGDKIGFQKAEDALDEVREAQAKVKEKPVEKKVESDPEFDAWRAENT